MSVCRRRSRAAPDGGEESAVTSRRSRRPKGKQPRPLPPSSTLTSPHECLESSEVPKDPSTILNFASTCQRVKKRITNILLEPVTSVQKPGSNLGKFGFGRENDDLDGSKKRRSLLPPLREVPTGLGIKESLAKIRTHFQLCETTPPDTPHHAINGIPSDTLALKTNRTLLIFVLLNGNACLPWLGRWLAGMFSASAVAKTSAHARFIACFDVGFLPPSPSPLSLAHHMRRPRCCVPSSAIKLSRTRPHGLGFHPGIFKSQPF